MSIEEATGASYTGKNGGGIAKRAALELEGKTGNRVLAGENYLPPKSGKLLGGK